MEKGGSAQEPQGEPEPGLTLLTGADWSAEPALRHSSSAGCAQLEAIQCSGHVTVEAPHEDLGLKSIHWN